MTEGTATATTGHAAARVTHPSGATRSAATLATARRSALQYLRTPQLLVLPTIMGALFLSIFRYVFGGAIGTGGPVDYVDYLVPGFIVTTILWTGMNAPAGVAEDASSGVHDRLRSLPIPRTAVMAGRSFADTALGCWTLSTTTALGVAVGFRTQGDLGRIFVAIAVLIAATHAFSWVFIAVGIVAGNAQAAQGMASVVVVPFSFLSSAYVPVDSMPGWMQAFASNQPVTAIINAVRSLLLGGTRAAGIEHSTTYWVSVSLLWCAGILVVFGAIATARFSQRR
jgi:ABC transporter DrrB family efflux protein